MTQKKKKIKCEQCGRKYLPEKDFNLNLAFAWCLPCLKDYDKETKERFLAVVKKHLDEEFDSEYEKAKFAWGLIK